MATITVDDLVKKKLESLKTTNDKTMNQVILRLIGGLTKQDMEK